MARVTGITQFLANVNLRSRSLYMLSPFRLSVLCLSVTLVRPTQPLKFSAISLRLFVP